MELMEPGAECADHPRPTFSGGPTSLSARNSMLRARGGSERSREPAHCVKPDDLSISRSVVLTACPGARARRRSRGG